MAAKPKAKPTKQKKMTAKQQSERFIQTARELEADESGKLFDNSVKAILQPKKATPLSSSDR
jgi:hypothetical protein